MADKSAAEKPAFCTLLYTVNTHFTKDVGLIPYGMYRFEGYDSLSLLTGIKTYLI